MRQKAREYVFLLLKFRLRSERELRERLKNKKFEPWIIEETVAFLKEKGFIDDDYFAKEWIDSRIKRPLGIRRLKNELIVKGIDKAIIDSRIAEIRKNYSEEDIVRRLVKDKLNRIKGSDPQKARKRIYAYFLRRGFSPEIVISALDEARPDKAWDF